MTSPRANIPKSPCNASAGCRKNDGVPVLESVAEILRPIRPDLPIPVTATRPLQARSTSTAFAKVASSRALTSSMARASIASTLRAVSRLTSDSASSFMFPNAAPATTILSGGTTNRLIAVAARHSLRPKARLADCRASPRRSRLLRQLWRRGPAAR